jgi:hypothetical protein
MQTEKAELLSKLDTAEQVVLDAERRMAEREKRYKEDLQAEVRTLVMSTLAQFPQSIPTGGLSVSVPSTPNFSLGMDVGISTASAPIPSPSRSPPHGSPRTPGEETMEVTAVDLDSIVVATQVRPLDSNVVLVWCVDLERLSVI